MMMTPDPTLTDEGSVAVVAELRSMIDIDMQQGRTWGRLRRAPLQGPWLLRLLRQEDPSVVHQRRLHGVLLIPDPTLTDEELAEMRASVQEHGHLPWADAYRLIAEVERLREQLSDARLSGAG